MYLNTRPTMLKKRPNDEPSTERSRKNPFGTVAVENEHVVVNSEKIFRFRILLPNGKTLELKMNKLDVPVEEFLTSIRREYLNVSKHWSEPSRKINWTYADIHLTDAQANKIRTEIKSCDFVYDKWHFLSLHDGSAEPDAYEDMWDLTPDTELLKELPDDYTFEAALADLIDNSLQAVWCNQTRERRLISVNINKNKISIFDSGPGMDGASEKIVKWGKMGASMHRSYRKQAIGGKPPYLMPYFGMFGYGGPVATMYLGRRAIVSSKTKTCNKVYTLHLEKEALINSSRSENCWKTKGGIRDPYKGEKEKSPHGSFTKVEILEPNMTSLDVKMLQAKLKDIYFPYIQCDGMAGKTSTPIEFQVNGIDLTEVQDGEVAITNMHSCNGPNFVLQLHFSYEDTSSQGQKKTVFLDANARLKCVYFPVIKGEETINQIRNILKANGCETRESFESFSRVSIRRLGRLLPDARWAWLPFMEPKPKKGEKSKNLKRCFYRVKCFIETDSGFNPTPSKTDLAHHHKYTTALKSFGHTPSTQGKEVQIEICRDGKKMTLQQLEKQYNDWILEMHDKYDEEVERGQTQEQPTIIISSAKIERLGMSSDVLSVHKEIKRNGKCWKSGQKMKVLKGACAGFHKKNVFVELEFIILEGLQEDACGEARLICRPLGLPKERGCRLLTDDGDNALDICDSISLPITVIDSEKLIAIGNSEWNLQLEQHKQKLPGSIDLLSPEESAELEIEGGISTDIIEADHAFPDNVVAVVRPKAFDSAVFAKRLDQKFIVEENLEMSLEVTFKTDDRSTKSCDHIYSARIKNSSCKGLHGFYIFYLGAKFSICREPGFYSLSFHLADWKDVQYKKIVQVKASVVTDTLRLVRHQNQRCPTSYPGPPERIIVHPSELRKQLLPGQIIGKLVLEVFDAHGNHANEDDTISLCADGFSFQDESSFINNVTNCTKRVDADGHVDLSNILKVTKGYGQIVSFSALSKERVIFKMEFQTEIRELRTMSKVFKNCESGSQLENIMFEVVDSDGSVDESIHNDDKSGQLHTITLMSNWLDSDDLPRYSFSYGRCKIHAITLPETEGIVTLRAVHSHHPELSLIIKVHLEKLWKESHDIWNHGDFRNFEFSPRVSSSNFLPTPLQSPTPIFLDEEQRNKTPESLQQSVTTADYSICLKTPKQDRLDVCHKISDRNKVPVDMLASQDEGYVTGPSLTCPKDLEDDLFNSGLKIGEHENKLKFLEQRRSAIQQNISDLQASIERDPCNMSVTWGKNSIIKEIESKRESLAAFVCKSLREKFTEERFRGVLGVVALIGSVQPVELSRMLTRYIGEEQMLAIVCKNYAAAKHLETRFLLELESRLGLSTSGRFLALCLEDIRPMNGEEVTDTQNLSFLPDPTMPNGEEPQGFLGYAIDLIQIEDDLLGWRTPDGQYGLRETLLYRLFGELQIYENKKCMEIARPCIREGAISLDGGIMRGNGVISLGNEQLDIKHQEVIFPVKNRMHLSPLGLQAWEEMESEKKMLAKMNRQIYEESKAYEMELENFQQSRDRYNGLSQVASSSPFGDVLLLE